MAAPLAPVAASAWVRVCAATASGMELCCICVATIPLPHHRAPIATATTATHSGVGRACRRTVAVARRAPIASAHHHHKSDRSGSTAAECSHNQPGMARPRLRCMLAAASARVNWPTVQSSRRPHAATRCALPARGRACVLVPPRRTQRCNPPTPTTAQARTAVAPVLASASVRLSARLSASASGAGSATA